MSQNRRVFLLGVGATVVTLALLTLTQGVAKAAPPAASTPVKLSNLALGGLVAAIGGAHITIVVDPALAATQLRVGEGNTVDIAQNILLKGEGPARARFLDDARNSAPVGTAVKQALGEALPQARSDIEAQHRKWAQSFARRVLNWNKAIQDKVTKQIYRPSEHTYLLEWAGATTNAKGQAVPAGVKKAPAQPSAPTLAAYESYLDALVATLRSP